MIKLCKSKVRRLLALIITLVLLVTFCVNLPLFSKVTATSCVGEEARSSGEITDAEDYCQSFIPANDHLEYIEVKFATYPMSTLVSSGSIVFTLKDSSGNTLCTKTVAAEKIKDDQFYRFTISDELSSGKTYTFTLQAENFGFSPAPIAWVTKTTDQEETILTFSGSSGAYQTCAQFGYSNMNTGNVALCLLMISFISFLLFFDVRLPQKRRWLQTVPTLIVSAVAMFAIVESLNGYSAFDKTREVFALNFIFYLLLYIVSMFVFNRLRVSLVFSNTIVFVFAIANYFKLQFRGEPLQPWDFFSAGTAASVSSGYVFSLSVVLIVATLAFILLNTIIWKIHFKIQHVSFRAVWGVVGIGVSCLLVSALFGTDRYSVAASTYMQKLGIVNNVWNQTSNYEVNGLVIAFTMNAQYMSVDKPSSYGIDEVENLKTMIETGSEADQISYSARLAAISTAESIALTSADAAVSVPTDANTASDAQDDAVVTQEDPNIICIMCESFADLDHVGDFTTNIEVTPFIDSLTENTIKGYMYVSTYGGGTANTEFEFNTGNTMAFLPHGSIPYQQYISQTTGSLANILTNDGYSAIAVHPFEASGWNRTEVYEDFGFDQFLSQDDFTNPQYYRKYITDECSYDKLIELYENKEEGQPIFLFNVTMQNHGGYTKTYDNFTNSISVTSFAADSATEQYLSLVHESDAALEDIVNYFSTVDEPTVICFFGDHLPSLKNGFYSDIMGKDLSDLSAEEMMQLYNTPFVIWANYDIPEDQIDRISANYLSTLLMQIAGIELPDYNIFLSNLYQQYPVITSMGIYDAQGNYYPSVSDVPNNEALLQYSVLEYNNLFDNSGRDATIFDSASSYATAQSTPITGDPTGSTDETEESDTSATSSFG